MPRAARAAVAAAFFLILAYWCLGANLFRHESIAPMDLLSSVTGYAEGSAPLPLINNEKSDILDSLLPSWRFVKQELRSGHLPQWNPLSTGGEPALSLGGAFLSPRFLCFLLFPDPLGYSLGLVLELAIAGLGAFLLCRLGLGLIPSIFAGITYMMCGFNSAWAQWPQVSTSCWIPWILWALVRLFEKPSGSRIVVLACAVAAMLLGGFPAVAAYGFYLAALLGAWLLLDRARAGSSLSVLGWRAGAAVAAVGIGFLLSAVQVVPFLDYLREFDLSRRRAQGIDLASARYLLSPFADGTPRVESAAYAGIAALILATCGVLLAPLRAARRPRTAALAVAPWLAALILTWAAVYSWPGKLAAVLYRLPVLNFNASNRMTVLLGLELAILAAVGLESLLTLFETDRQPTDTLLRRNMPAAASAILLLVQCRDEVRISRAHNAVVPSSSFFPARSAIDLVRSRILPGQSVIGTIDAYFVSGTLGSYGLAEWFSHSYRTPVEKALLEKVVKDPWATWTAAVFPFERVDLQSPYFDALGIRFVMTSDRKPMLLGVDSNDRPSPLLTQNRIGQTLRLKQPLTSCSLAIVFGTYDRPYADAALRLRFFSKGSRELAASVISAEQVRNNQWAEFPFEKPLALGPGEYEFTVESVKGAEAAPISAWTLTGEDRFVDGYQTVNGEPAVGDLRFQVLACAHHPPRGWTVAWEAKGILVLERNDSPPGAYLVDAQRFDEPPAPGALEWKTVRQESFSSDRQVYVATAERRSLFVRTLRKWKGWKAYVDGVEKPLRAYQQVLSAVEIGEGTHRIEFRYLPRSWPVGLALSALGALVAAGLVFIDRRKPAPGTSAQ